MYQELATHVVDKINLILLLSLIDLILKDSFQYI